MTKYDNTEQTIIIVSLTISPLFMSLLVRLTVYIENLYVFYSYRIIGKLTDFFQFQEFNFRNLPDMVVPLPPLRVLLTEHLSLGVPSSHRHSYISHVTGPFPVSPVPALAGEVAHRYRL